ncbi:MAG: ECF transporter S component, partial [Clostridia bacterium]|nr:ECF transporter S component [Clostridia bacterium]
GSMLLPMHIPVFLCALICGWQYATPMAFILPILRSLIFSMPPMYPTAAAMAFELAAYAFVSGFIYSRFKKQGIIPLYISIISAMIIGRLVWGAAQMILLGISGKTFTFSAFLAGALLNAIPGIIVQLILIPAVMFALDRAKLLPFRRGE